VPWRLASLALVLLLTLRVASAGDCRPITDFGQYTVGDYPDDWKPREERAREIYQVLEQGGVRFIRGTARSTGLQIGKEFGWDLEAFPLLAWKWRPQLVPHGADEREPGRNDSALGVYAVFPHGPVSVKAVKYVWSARAPAGTTATASRGLTRMVVRRSGERNGAAWVEETVNVAQDYRRLFGEAPPQPRGIALLTDADDTKGAAVGDYTDFRVCAGDGQAPAATPARPVKPAAGKRLEKPRATASARRPAPVEERTPPVDRPSMRPGRPVTAAPGSAFAPEPR
jgi:hypothetical protein